MEDTSYTNYLLTLLDNHELITESNDEFKLNLYLTLLFLNNHNYHKDIYNKEINIIENFLRKINNYKVKIQLKRKIEEIEKLYNEIKEIYEKDNNTINKYNKDNLDITDILERKDAIEITKLIDKLTKIKLNKTNNLKYYNEVINKLNNHFDKYYLENNILTINDDIVISLEEFYDIFDYLTNIDNYNEVYSKEISNNNHRKIITDIIDLVTDYTKNIGNNIIPIILSYLIVNDIPNYEEIATDKFHIDNIKISDLYTLANSTINGDNKVKWRNIIISNDYLYNKIKEIVTKGMYYFKDDNFIIENIDNTVSDFKISIDIPNMIAFIKDNLNLLNNKSIKKHICK